MPGVPIYALGDAEPNIAEDAFVHPDAVVIGNVTIGSQSTVWPGAVLRGDYGRIEVGERTSIQDGTVIHCTPVNPTIVGNDCVIGHLVHLEGCTIRDHSLVGSGSVVLHNVVVESWAIVGANAVVTDGTLVPSKGMALGVPAKIREGAARPEEIQRAVQVYIDNGARYRRDLKLLG